MGRRGNGAAGWCSLGARKKDKGLVRCRGDTGRGLNNNNRSSGRYAWRQACRKRDGDVAAEKGPPGAGGSRQVRRGSWAGYISRRGGFCEAQWRMIRRLRAQAETESAESSLVTVACHPRHLDAGSSQSIRPTRPAGSPEHTANLRSACLRFSAAPGVVPASNAASNQCRVLTLMRRLCLVFVCSRLERSPGSESSLLCIPPHPCGPCLSSECSTRPLGNLRPKREAARHAQAGLTAPGKRGLRIPRCDTNHQLHRCNPHRACSPVAFTRLRPAPGTAVASCMGIRATFLLNYGS